MPSKKVSIFIKSYAGDFPWLGYCLRSIHKYVAGVHEIVLALPPRHGLPLTRERVVEVEEWSGAVPPGAPSPGYYQQMYVKLCADLYCPDADFILYLDSDCVFERPFDVSEMFRDGLPMLLCRPWNEAGDGVAWREPAEKALRLPAPFDTMACHPSIYRKDTVRGVRRWIELRHGIPLESYVRASAKFIEFVTLGNFAIHWHPEEYYMIRCGPNDGYPRPLRQLWSWGGITPEIRAELEEICK